MLDVGISNQLNYMKDTNIKTALVSTNSICQGEQASYIMEETYRRWNIY